MAVTIYEALQLIEKSIPAISTEIIPIENALNRVASRDVKATLALPTFNNSAMDGYGLKGEAKEYTLIGKILAGDSHTYTLKDGECIKILTGAQVPNSVERIIPQENTEQNKNIIKIIKPVKIGANIRHMGEDIHEGETIIKAGSGVNSTHIALLASQGITHIEVNRKVKIGVFASGSELKLHFEKLNNAQVYNSNTLYLLARSQELHCETRFVGKSEDSVDSLKALVKAALDCDLIVTSGGVSVGEADFTKEAFSALGMEIFFNKVQVKPGKPTTFGKIGNTLVLNLPGNPLAAALNFELFGTFIIHALQGLTAKYHNYILTPLSRKIDSPRPVANIVPGWFDGQTFTPSTKYAPGMVNVLSHCNGVIIIDPETNIAEEGKIVKFLPIRWDFLKNNFEEIMS
jgi:molybdopterin molybdotransferase